MSDNRKLNWLKRILVIKIALIIFAWGLPVLLAPLSFFKLLGVPMPDDPLYMRLFGAVVMAFGVAYWYAFKDPVHNVAILKAAVVDNGLVTLTILVFIVFHDLRSVFMWISALLTFLLFLAFILLMPKTETA